MDYFSFVIISINQLPVGKGEESPPFIICVCVCVCVCTYTQRWFLPSKGKELANSCDFKASLREKRVRWEGCWLRQRQVGTTLSRSWARTPVPKYPRLCFSATVQARRLYQFTVTKWPFENVLLPPNHSNIILRAKACKLEIKDAIFSMASSFLKWVSLKNRSHCWQGAENMCLARIYQQHESVTEVCTALRTSCHAPRVWATQEHPRRLILSPSAPHYCVVACF